MWLRDCSCCSENMNLLDWLIRFLQATAWKMDVPALFSPFHLSMTLLSVLIPYILVCHQPINKTKAEQHLFHMGMILLMLELYKQGFYYVVVNHMRYDWWHFPFQLCSMAMYLCLLLPLTKGRFHRTILTFLYDFSLPGALLALLFPEDMLRPYWAMTLHGFLWHAMLVYIALIVYRNELADPSWSGFSDAGALYLFLAASAFILNILIHPYASFGFQPNYFYLSPYEKTGQFFFRLIAERFGITVELLLYLFLYILFCALFHAVLRKTSRC